MAGTDLLDESMCWRISGVHDSEAFFRAIPLLTPDATHLLLEGAPSRDVVAALAAHRDERREHDVRPQCLKDRMRGGVASLREIETLITGA
jgi:hypothetical protein